MHPLGASIRSVVSQRSTLSPLLAAEWSVIRRTSSVSVTAVSRDDSKKSELMMERFYKRINVKVKGYDFPVLDSYMKFVTTAAYNLDIAVSGVAYLPTKIRKYTVLKSPHIFKKHRVQYEMRTHSRVVQVSYSV